MNLYGTDSKLENWPSRSSPECSPLCQGGGRGFKSHRGRFQVGTVRKPAERPGSNPGDLWVQIPPVLPPACVGWASASPSVCNTPAPGFAGSTPARRTRETLSSIGEDTWFSARRGGSDSRKGYSVRRKVSGYGWPGLFAKECAPWGMRVRIPCLPLASMVKRTITPRS